MGQSVLPLQLSEYWRPHPKTKWTSSRAPWSDSFRKFPSRAKTAWHDLAPLHLEWHLRLPGELRVRDLSFTVTSDYETLVETTAKKGLLTLL